MCSITEAHELLKIPVIFQHYIEHQQEDKGISITKFLSIHYLEGDIKDKDYERDMQLPFKTTGEFFASSVTPFMPLNTQMNVQYPYEPLVKVWALQKPSFIFSAYQVNIWQPPKLS